MPDVFHTRLPNGLHLVGEPMTGVGSLAMTLLTPAGVASQPADKQGVSSLLAEMVCRGAGGRSAREHSDALDMLGVQRGVSPQTRFMRLGATMLAERFDEALPLLLDMMREPTLGEDGLAPSVDLALQSIDSLADEPQRRAMLELRKQHFPGAMGWSSLGEREHLQKMRVEDVRSFWADRFVADGSILGVAGAFDWPEMVAKLTDALGGWGGAAEPFVGGADAGSGYHHAEGESTQVHIALAYPTVAETHEQSVLQQAAVAVLSGGMSGRLFTEVREKRGLCYSVYASYSGQKDRGDVLAYAGTTVPRAQETLDVLSGELKRLSEGINQSEFDRAIVGMKSRLVMQGESTGARAAAIASDQYLFGQPKTLEEVAAEVDGVTLDALNDFVKAHRPEEMTVVTLGPEALVV